MQKARHGRRAEDRSLTGSQTPRAVHDDNSGGSCGASRLKKDCGLARQSFKRFDQAREVRCALK